MTNFARPLRQVHGKGRLFSEGRIHCAIREGDIHESMGSIERDPEKTQHFPSFVNDSIERWQEEQECEDEIFSSIGECFIEVDRTVICRLLNGLLYGARSILSGKIPSSMYCDLIRLDCNVPGKMQIPEVSIEDLKSVEVCMSISECFIELEYKVGK
jgi:hypothetical protein